MGTNPGNRIRVRNKEKEKEKEEIEINGSSGGGNNGGNSREPPPPKEPIPVNLQDCMNDIRSQYGDEVAEEVWQRVLDNSPPGDKSRMTVAYLRTPAVRIVEYRQREADLRSGKIRHDERGLEIWDDYESWNEKGENQDGDED